MSKNLFGYEVDQQWEYENGFYLTSQVSRLHKILAHYELYKSIVNLPGHCVECGVYKGASLIRFCTFREMLESPNSRKIIGFDAFGKFPPQDGADDARFIEGFEKLSGDGISVEALKEVLAHKSIENYELIEGDVVESIPAYLSAHPELKISLLHIDVDVYRPTVAILEHLYERVVRNGLVVFDDYGMVPGETKAVDEFLAGKDVVIEKLPISHVPAFIRKK